jgi:hypothetical protein
MLTNDKNMAVATQYRFQRITPSYTLVYTDEEPEGVNCTEIKAEEISNLSRKDFQWLADSNLILLREFVEEHKDSQVQSLKKFFEELDKNIKEELKEKDGERKKSATE